jgi:hypothetical protein
MQGLGLGKQVFYHWSYAPSSSPPFLFLVIFQIGFHVFPRGQLKTMILYLHHPHLLDRCAAPRLVYGFIMFPG